MRTRARTHVDKKINESKAKLSSIIYNSVLIFERVQHLFTQQPCIFYTVNGNGFSVSLSGELIRFSNKICQLRTDKDPFTVLFVNNQPFSVMSSIFKIPSNTLLLSLRDIKD